MISDSGSRHGDVVKLCRDIGLLQAPLCSNTYVEFAHYYDWLMQWSILTVLARTFDHVYPQLA